MVQRVLVHDAAYRRIAMLTEACLDCYPQAIVAEDEPVPERGPTIYFVTENIALVCKGTLPLKKHFLVPRTLCHGWIAFTLPLDLVGAEPSEGHNPKNTLEIKQYHQ